MKKLAVCLAMFMLFAGVAYGAEVGKLIKGQYVRGEKTLPLAGFWVNDETGGDASGENEPVPLSFTTTPGIEYDDKQTNVVWADGETTRIEQTFVVPSDYVSNGRFEAFFTRTSGGDDAPSVDFKVYINKDDTTVDTSATDETAVELTDAYDTSPDIVTLTPSTDSFSPGDRVTLYLWRDDVDTSTLDLELKGDVLFIYNKI